METTNAMPLSFNLLILITFVYFKKNPSFFFSSLVPICIISDLEMCTLFRVALRPASFSACDVFPSMDEMR